MISRLKALFATINALPCYRCGCRHTVTRNESYLDPGNPVLCEFDVDCAECGVNMNNWAYGYFQFPTTYTELVRDEWRYVRSCVKDFFRRWFK